jgi:hypothetical protein
VEVGVWLQFAELMQGIRAQRVTFDLVRVDFFRAAVFERLRALCLEGPFMICLTADTRSELTPGILPVSSGVGPGLPVM